MSSQNGSSSSSGSMAQTAEMLQRLMNDLTSANNEARSQAEAHLNHDWVLTQPNSLISGLSYLISNSQDSTIRAFACVLLRRIAFRPAIPMGKSSAAEPASDQIVWQAISEQTRQTTKQDLLNALLNSTPEPATLHKICDTISEIASPANFGSSEEAGAAWPELPAVLSNCAQSANPQLRVAAFKVFANVPSLLMTNQQQHSIEQIVVAFNGAFQDNSSDVRLASLQAAVHFLLSVSNNSSSNAVPAQPAQMVPHMLTVLKLLLQEKNETGLIDAISSLTELAEDYPKYFRGVLPALVEFCTLVAKSRNELEDSTRQASLELLVTLAEVAPGMVRKYPEFCESTIPVALQMLSEIGDDDDEEEDQDWYNTDSLEVDDNEENYVFGEQTMDRLACSLGGKQVLAVSFKYIPQMLSSPSNTAKNQWKQKHAALMAISAIGEGCYKIMVKELKPILEMILPFFKDPHPRVRWAVCNAVGQLSTDFSPIIQKLYHDQILSCLIPAMDEADFPRVQSHAAAAMVNFSEDIPKSIIEPYLNDLFERLLKLLNSSKRYVQEQAITTIATVADSAQDKFEQYYSRIMPLLLNVLENATQKEHRLLRGKTLECATFVALAVGRKTFSADVDQFVRLMQNIQQSVTEPDDPQASYLLAGWARLCKILEEDFIPLMPVVMPPLLQSASLQPDFAILDADEDPEAQYSAEDGWEFANVGGQQIGLKTSILEEKCTAVEMLICYARELPSGFIPYANQVLDIALPLFKFYFHEGVRSAATISIPAIMSAMKKAIDPSNQQQVAELQQAWNRSFQKFVDAIKTEADEAFTMQLLNSLAEAIEAVGQGCLNGDQMTDVTETLVALLTKYIQRIKERHDLRGSNGGQLEDEDDEEALVEDEAIEGATIDEIGRCLHAIFKTQGTNYLPYFENQLLEIAMTFLTDQSYINNPKEASSMGKQWAICVFDDLIEFTGPASSVYAPKFFNIMIQSIIDPASSDIRQAAAYGVGVAAQFGGDSYAEAVAAAIPNLKALMTLGDARSEENVYPTENAISAITKILKFNSSKVNDPHQLLADWFFALPIANDEDEAPMTYSYFVELLENNAQMILGLKPTGSNASQFDLGNGISPALAQCVSALTQVLVTDILPTDLSNQLVNVLKKLMSSDVSEAQQAVLWQNIPVENQKILKLKGFF
ncbi:importin subunit beta-3 [Mycoemilia scoparia]|uniref:Importin subunit beta-3 n=1 Tax=Mycoemilia scoparia TaxID=417184 RepID=A0A9W7ZN00_9FUNG|nr:importin subunit beta-3 [Mycoemilia scoparia]